MPAQVEEDHPQPRSPLLREITALFGCAAISINEMPSSGHNLSVGLSARSYHQQVLSFVEECVAARCGGAKEAEAG